MRKDCFNRIGKKILSKLGKLLLIAIIGYITWATVVAERNSSQAEKLYRDGKELYKESKDTAQFHYVMYDDSSYQYIEEKEEK